MRTILLLAWASVSVISCKKAGDTGNSCFPGSSTVRYITNKQASIKVVGNQFYLVEENSIDSKLNPCNLPDEFRIHDLQVMISGEVKSTIQHGPAPCCTENFVITGITQ